MFLAHKPDWEEAQEHYLAWWAGDAFERCALAVTAPRGDASALPAPELPVNPVDRWTDLDYIAACNEHRHRSTFFGGEAFPVWEGGYPGHTSIPAFLGCPTYLDENTGWWEPILTEDDWEVGSFRIDPENAWWKFTLAQLKRGLEECGGKSIPAIGGALGGCGDTLAALRGTHRLLYDVVLCPDRVRNAELVLMEMWTQVYDALYTVTREAAEGSTCWFHLWSPGRFYPAHNDFSYMISAEMFCDLFLPAIERQTRFLDHTVYHVDGVSAFRHVPALLELPRLQAFQIAPGAGKPSPLAYLDTLRLVQDKGRNLHLTIPAEEVEMALDMLSARGLFLATHCETEEQARYLLKQAKKWSHD